MGEQPQTFTPGKFYVKPIGAPDSEIQELKIVSSKEIKFDLGAPEGDMSFLSMPQTVTFQGTVRLSKKARKEWARLMKMPSLWLFYTRRHPRKSKKQFKKAVEASLGHRVYFKYAFKHHKL